MREKPITKIFTKKIYISYSALFILICLIINLPQLITGNGFLFFDGLAQHALFMRDYVSAIKNALSGGGFEFWNWNLGLGADTIISYGYYSVFDPLTVIAYILPLDAIEFSYYAIALVRLYLTGLFFLLYIKNAGIKSHAARLCSALLYVFSFAVIFSFGRHPMFTNGPMLLPLIALGTDKILEGKRPYILIAAAFYMLISQFYIFIYASVFFEAYLFLKYFTKNGRAPFKKWFPKILTPNLCYLLGALLGGFLLVPEFLGVMGGSRIAGKGLLVYDIDYYSVFLLSIFFPFPAPYYTANIGNFLLLLAALLYVFKKGNQKWAKIMFVSILALMAFSPFGYAINLFSYVNNRWAFIICFPAAFMAAGVIEQYGDYRTDADVIKKALYTVGGLLCAGLALCALGGFIAKSGVLLNVLALCGALLIFAAGLFFALKRPAQILRRLRLPQRSVAVVCLIVCTALTVCAFNIQKSANADYYAYGSLNERYKNPLDYALSGMDGQFYRAAKVYDEDDIIYFVNDSLYYKYGSAFFYNSVSPQSVNSFISFFNVRNLNNTVGYNGTDNRAVLDGLLSVRYYALTDGQRAYLPYGYTQHSSGEGFGLYQNQNALPLGFTCANVISLSDAQNAEYLERMALIENNVIVPDNIASGFNPAQPRDCVKPLAAEIVSLNGVTLSEGSVKAARAGGEIVFSLARVKDAELYIKMTGIENKSGEKYGITFSTQTSKKVVGYPYGANFYTGNTDYLVNAGYYKDSGGEIEAVIRFDTAGSYSFEQIGFYAYSMEGYESNAQAMKNNGLENITVTKNRINGEIDVSQKSVLFLSVPYQKGWQAYVDGKPAQTFEANIGFTGIVLEAGRHTVELKYATPFLSQGAAVSIVALGALIGITVFIEIKKHKIAKEEVEND